MKKKIEALLKDGSLEGNAGFAPVFKAHQSAKNAFEKAKKAKFEAKQAYRSALEQGEKDNERLLELLTAFRQAKSMQQYHRAGFKLALHRLHGWVESWLKNAEVPHEPKKAKTAQPKAPKTTKAKALAKTGKTPKAAGKAAKAAH